MTRLFGGDILLLAMADTSQASKKSCGGRIRYPIRVVSRRTGLSQDLIRAWERRYGAVEPERTPTGRRLYTDKDLTRLSLLRQALEAGSRIGDVALLTEGDLRRLIDEDSALAMSHPTASVPSVAAPQPASRSVERCLEALDAVDGRALRQELRAAAVDYSLPVVLDHVLGPFLRQIGDLWRSGKLRIVQERLAVQIVQPFLMRLRERSPAAPNAPVVVVATPTGQRHGLGAGLAAVSAAAQGWNVVDLGSELPPEELAAAVMQTRARALALSIVYPLDDPNLGSQLHDLKQLLPQGVVLFAGGRGASAYSSSLEEVGAVLCPTLDFFRRQLEALRPRPMARS